MHIVVKTFEIYFLAKISSILIELLHCGLVKGRSGKGRFGKRPTPGSLVVAFKL